MIMFLLASRLSRMVFSTEDFILIKGYSSCRLIKEFLQKD